jgi:hypothetical protein
MGHGDDDRRDTALAALKVVFLAAVNRGRSAADSLGLSRKCAGTAHTKAMERLRRALHSYDE